MPKYKFSFEREVTETEGFERVIEAPSFAEAEAAAHNLASEFNRECPDDCSEVPEGDGSAITAIGGFTASSPPAIRDVAPDGEMPDYVVLPDGQCVPGEGDVTTTGTLALDACDLAELLDRADQRHESVPGVEDWALALLRNAQRDTTIYVEWDGEPQLPACEASTPWSSWVNACPCYILTEQQRDACIMAAIALGGDAQRWHAFARRMVGKS